MGDGMAVGKTGLLRLILGNSAIQRAMGKADELRMNYEGVAEIAKTCDIAD